MADQLTGKTKRLGILTGGGDVPGLNAAIKAVVYRAGTAGIEVVGIRRGWEGVSFLDRSVPLSDLTFNMDNPDTWRGAYLWPLNRNNTRSIDQSGGTILGSTRTNPARVKVSELPDHLAAYRRDDPDARVDLTAEVLRNLESLELDGLIVIGGDDTLSYGSRLDSEGFPVWGIPKTMDNDVPGTEYAIGFGTAISRASEFITRLRSTAASHGHTLLVRMFGRDAGFTALETALVTWADRVLIPEVACHVDRLAELIVSDRKNPYGYSIVLMSEGAKIEDIAVPEVGPADAYGHRAKANVAEFLASELAKRIPKVRFLPVDLTYILRSGEPDHYDKHVAIHFANLAMSLVEQGTHGAMTAFRRGEYIYTDIPSKQLSARRVDPADYNADRYRPNHEGITGRYLPQG